MDSRTSPSLIARTFQLENLQLHALHRHDLQKGEESDLYFPEQRILEAQWEWYWPLLEPLWNPTSKAHWIKIVKILRHFELKTEHQISPALLLSAARHGEAVILECKRLQELVMDRFHDPLLPHDWQKIKEKDDFRKCNQLLARSKSTRWRPLNYNEMIAHINKNAKELWRSVPEGVQTEEIDAQNYMTELFENLSAEKDLRMQQSRIMKIHVLNCELKIEVQQVQRAAVEEGECAICREILVDHEDICESILKAASTRKEQLQNTTMKAADTVALKFLKPDVGAEELSERLLDSYDELKKLMDEPKCVQAVKVRCGHVFGLDCLQKWFLGGHFTCPICRAKLLDPRSNVLAVSSRSIDELFHFGSDFMGFDFAEDTMW